MIKLLKIPNEISLRVLEEENRLYVQECNLPILGCDLVAREFNMPGYEYYHVYNNSTKIGFASGFKQDEYWYACRVYLYKDKRRYFKHVIDKLSSMAISKGLKGIIAHPDTHTAGLYKKHKIAKEI